MKSHPILFSAPMVRALLDGSKTQTRRVLRLKPGDAFGIESVMKHGGQWTGAEGGYGGLVANVGGGTFSVPLRCPYGAVGDRLWVKEAIARFDWIDGGETSVEYVATPGVMHDDAEWVWKRAKLPGMFMPRGLSRIMLEITDVRVQWLQEISDSDCIAEGIGGEPIERDAVSPQELYRDLWDSINGAGAWDANPWVWALTFRRVTA